MLTCHHFEKTRWLLVGLRQFNIGQVIYSLSLMNFKFLLPSTPLFGQNSTLLILKI
jgi:hypothetical protein